MTVGLNLGLSKKGSNVLFWNRKKGTICWDLYTHCPKRCAKRRILCAEN